VVPEVPERHDDPAMAVERSCFHMAVAGFSEIRESLNRFPDTKGFAVRTYGPGRSRNL